MTPFKSICSLCNCIENLRTSVAYTQFISDTIHLSSHTSHLISPTHLTQLISHHSHLTQLISHTTHLAQLISHTSSHRRVAWQAQYTEPSGAAARIVAGGPRLFFAWQAQYTEPEGGLSPVGRGSSLRGRRSTQSLLTDLRGGLSPVGRGSSLRGRRSTQSLLTDLRGGLSPVGRVCVAGAVHAAS